MPLQLESRSWFDGLDSAPVWAAMLICYPPLLAYGFLRIIARYEWGRRLVHRIAPPIRTGVQKLLVFLLPRLLSEKKVQLESDTMCNVLHFMDRPLDGDNVEHWCNYVTFWVFGSLVLNILCMTVFAFFRYFPIEKSNECREYDSNFRKLYCFTNTSDLPVNCADIGNSTEVICYAYRLDLPLAIGASYGLMKFAGFMVTAGVYAAKLWIENASKLVNFSPRRCKSLWHFCTTEICCTMWFIVLFVGGLIAAGVCAAAISIYVRVKKASQVPETQGEFYYDMAYVVILVLVLPFFFMCIPCLVLYHKGRPTYMYLATEDPPPSVINSRTELIQD